MSPTESKVDEITRVLRTEILTGQYRAGERLPSERDLAARFEANRGAIREALKRLEQLGIAEITRGGARVHPVEDASLDIIGHLLELGDEADKRRLFGQIMAVMGSMMALSARSAINAGSDEDREEIAHIIAQLIDSMGDPERHQTVWMSLGEKLMSVHHNLVLRLVGNGLRTQFMGKVTEMDEEPDLDIDALRHELINFRTAVLARDGRGASTAVTQHFQVIIDGINNINPSSLVPNTLNPTEDNFRKSSHV